MLAQPLQVLKQRIKQFCQASGLSSEGDSQQVSTLLYCMGETAEGVISSRDITVDEKQTYASVNTKFDSFFKVRKNVIFERARFNSCCQKDGESVEQFITSLYQLVEDCKYEALKDQIVRNRLDVGLRDLVLSQRLQMDPDLTLEKVKTLSHQREAVTEQQGLLHAWICHINENEHDVSFKIDTGQKSLSSPTSPNPSDCINCIVQLRRSMVQTTVHWRS